MTKNSQEHTGLTLVEILTTVALIGVATAVVMPNLSSFQQNNELNSSTKLVLSWLDDLRKEAIQKSVPCQADWNFDEGTLIGSCVDEPETKTLDINYSTSKTVAITKDYGSNTWKFTPRGTSNTSGQVFFRLGDSINLPARCIKLTSPLGLLQAGKYTSADTCDYTKSF